MVCGYIMVLWSVAYCFWVTLTMVVGLGLRKLRKTQVPRNVSETFVFGCMKVCLIAKVGFLNVKIKHSSNVIKTFPQRSDNAIL